MISIITATFNRAKLLERLYTSLVKQTDLNFEWVIINDGSSDNTVEIMAQWSGTPFIIKKYTIKNGGKHRAINYGIKVTEGDYIFIVDDDDYLLNNSIELINLWIPEIDKKDDFAAVAGLKAYSNGKIIGSFPNDKKYIDTNNLYAEKRGIKGDKAEIYKKRVLINYPFPEFKDERFISESSVWCKMAVDGYKIRFYPIPIYVGEYLPGGLTKSTNLQINNFCGYTYTEKLIFKYKPLPYNMLALVRYLDIASIKGLSNKEICSNLDTNYIILFIGKGLLKIKKIYKVFVNTKGKD